MRYLSAGLIGEGSTDDRFLPGLLTRALEDICLTEFTDEVEVADVRPLRSRTGPHNLDEVMALVDEQYGSFGIVFFHRDQGPSRERLEREWLTPLRSRWVSRAERLVPVVPVRETEAWMLADGVALRGALGVTWPDHEIGVPRSAREVERIADPKVPLRRLGQRVGRSIEDHYLEQLASRVSLPVLRRVPAFARWRDDTIATLMDVGLRPADQNRS